jgi:lipopolysaccharide export system protein LptA
VKLRLAIALLLAGLAPAIRAGAEPPSSAVDRLGLAVKSGEPLQIRADTLEALPDSSGRDRVVFEQNVSVSQGDMELRCDWLEALYPPRPEGSSSPVGGQPERITARGHVRILQAGNEAHCSEAIFDNQTCSAECTARDGRATLRRGSDVIEADRIQFDLCKGVLKALGDVVIRTQGTRPEP